MAAPHRELTAAEKARGRAATVPRDARWEPSNSKADALDCRSTLLLQVGVLHYDVADAIVRNAAPGEHAKAEAEASEWRAEGGKLIKQSDKLAAQAWRLRDREDAMAGTAPDLAHDHGYRAAPLPRCAGERLPRRDNGRAPRARTVRTVTRRAHSPPGSSSDGDSADPPLGGVWAYLARASVRMVAHEARREARWRKGVSA